MSHGLGRLDFNKMDHSLPIKKKKQVEQMEEQSFDSSFLQR